MVAIIHRNRGGGSVHSAVCAILGVSHLLKAVNSRPELASKKEGT